MTEKIAVLAPMPRARVRTTTVVNPGFLRSVRTPKRISMKKSSMEGQRQTVRLSSCTRVKLPNSRRAAAVACFLGMPLAMSSSIFSSRCA